MQTPLQSAAPDQGFTMIEVLMTMVIAMFVLAGMSAMFVSQTKTAQMLSKKSEIMNDLFLASQIMQFELRKAKAICWDAVNDRIIYQPLTSANDLTVACAEDVSTNGWFRMVAVAIPASSEVCWDRPDLGGFCQELIRDLKANVGLNVTPLGNVDLQAVRTITLTADYLDSNKSVQSLKMSFKIWPRNQQ